MIAQGTVESPGSPADERSLTQIGTDRNRHQQLEDSFAEP